MIRKETIVLYTASQCLYSEKYSAFVSPVRQNDLYLRRVLRPAQRTEENAAIYPLIPDYAMRIKLLLWALMAALSLQAQEITDQSENPVAFLSIVP